MTPNDFIAKWRNGGDERRDAQPFFEDLCRLVNHQTPREADPEHTWFTYEYGATKASGGEGWADVWKKDFFGWEAKGTNRSLEKAYEQLKMYADALQNPPLLVVSDLQTIVIHTNFTNTIKQKITFTVDQLADYETRKILENVFHNPQALRPGITRAAITKEAAAKFTALAVALRERGHAPQPVAHFLNRLLFCMFAEDIGLLPNNLFTKLVASTQDKPDQFEARSAELFRAMNTGGDVFLENIEWFNGGLFNDDETLRLESNEIKLLLDAARLDWSEIDPSIFGTLFERGLDPDKRSQLGAHYTDPETILKIVRPVIIEPWLAEWESEKQSLAPLVEKAMIFEKPATTSKDASARTKAFNEANKRVVAFLVRLRAFTVLDPACGSGNFLYLSLRALKDIEHRVLTEVEMLGLGRQFPAVSPACVKGIELNAYAAELARITVWIGEIQWMIQNGYGANKNPILQPLDQIENRDALLNPDGLESQWPKVNAIVGNPPFIGGQKMREELGSKYTETLRQTFDGRVEGSADFVCYWFEKARASIISGSSQVAGFVSTNSIRNGANRIVLDRIKVDLSITNAWSDEPWVNEGAAVRVSMTMFCKAPDKTGILDGRKVAEITSTLTELIHHDIATATPLSLNSKISFQGVIPRAEVQKKKKIALGLPDASFNLDGPVARKILLQPTINPSQPMSCVVYPYWVGDDIATRPLDRFIVNFCDKSESDAATFHEAFEAIKNVRLNREHMEEGKDKRNWWQLARWRPEMLNKLKDFERYISIPRVAKYHLCVWTPVIVVPDNALVVICRDDDTTFGILQSKLHAFWAYRMGSSLGATPRYTPTTCFETFPFPEGLTPDHPASAYANDPRAQRIATATQALVAARDRWLNPAEWVDRVPEVVPGYPDRIVAKPGHEAELKKRTLTNLYNTRPTWLDNLHRDLDIAVAAAYGWEWPLTDDEILRRLFELNQARAAGL